MRGILGFVVSRARSLNVVTRIAFRNLVRQFRRNLLLGIGIAISMCILVVTASFTNGLTDILFNKVMVYMTGHIRVVEDTYTPRRSDVIPIEGPYLCYTERVPLGVVALMTSFNHPLMIMCKSLGPVFASGCTTVVKPSEYTPRTSQWFVNLLAAELPDGLAAVVHGDGAAGQALIDAGIDACIFTGSPKSGRSVRLRCAERGIPSSMEMGGKDAAIVLADCDLERTVAGITHWALSNAGQSCGAIEIALVDDSIADRFVERLAKAWRRLRVGPDKFAEISPLANRRQFALLDRAGGYLAAHYAQKVPPVYVRALVIAIGFGMTMYFVAKSFQ
jgi:acyl-CoA reductase-like NAD-dependent aldehyde dehydrogenase